MPNASNVAGNGRLLHGVAARRLCEADKRRRAARLRHDRTGSPYRPTPEEQRSAKRGDSHQRRDGLVVMASARGVGMHVEALRGRYSDVV